MARRATRRYRPPPEAERHRGDDPEKHRGNNGRDKPARRVRGHVEHAVNLAKIRVIVNPFYARPMGRSFLFERDKKSRVDVRPRPRDHGMQRAQRSTVHSRYDIYRIKV